jgi:uncharacterized membrane protein
MKRIGMIAGKIAKDNLLAYNLYVLLFAGLFALIIALLSGFSLVAALAVVAHVTGGATALESGNMFGRTLLVSLVSLAVVVGIVTLVAVGVNLKIRK